MTYHIGQRWISNAEAQLGLGVITGINGRHISISFPAASEERFYAADTAPLSRIIYKPGEHISTLDDRYLTVNEVEEKNGLLRYIGVDKQGDIHYVDELLLNCFVNLITPEQRLLSNQIDKLRSFKLRIDTLNHLSQRQQSPVRGLLGSRTSHLPHQIYIAHEVAKRHAPRVLLADEVGLGKTIEAGMIVHYQLHTARASRVLIVVPDTLIHQWLVEMLRRFNWHFSIFDQSRYESACEENPESPFESEQLILCSLDFLLNNSAALEHAVFAPWDLLVVDEAHHLRWSLDEVSDEYRCIERLAAISRGLLLLTATPEQIGIESHFARLRLLDSSRFYDLESFRQDEAGYQALNDVVQALLVYRETHQIDALNDKLRDLLRPYGDVNQSSTISDAIDKLLDRHGTGRVLFRNTRAAIMGFPERQLHAYPLTKSVIYEAFTAATGVASLYPETIFSNNEWLQQDPRVLWLSNKLPELYPHKVLIICAHAKTAVALEKHLNTKIGIRSASFHEGLSIIERDRAAAFFSDTEDGAQVLVCSEIGSEGRNFQFAHHLVLFDLPLNPDLLEQRIGRLDRIGQYHTIQIHVPWIQNTAQERLFRWYHEGLNVFEKNCAAGFSIYQTFESELLMAINSEYSDDSNADFEMLLAKTKRYTGELNQILSQGRDCLLEMNSCKKAVANELIEWINTEEQSLELEHYMASVFHEYGIENEYHSDYAEVLRPTEHMKTSHFPGLKEEGMTVTYSRSKALIRDDMTFLSWEHPMVCQAMDMIVGSEMGNTSMVTMSIKGIVPGTLFLEAFYTINCAAPKSLQLERFLPQTPIRILVDITGKNLSHVLTYDKLNGLCETIKLHTAQEIIKKVHHDIDIMLQHSKSFATKPLQTMMAEAQTAMKEHLGFEIKRLEALQRINPSIRMDEIEFLRHQIVDSEHFIASSSLQLQALRLVVNK